MQLILGVLTFPFKVVVFPFKVLAWLFASDASNVPDADLQHRDFAVMRNQQWMNAANNRFINNQVERGAEASRRTHQQAIDYSHKQANISQSFRNR